MRDSERFDLDRSTASAWRRFRARLADHIAAMEDGDKLIVDDESVVADDDAGAAPYIQFCAWGEEFVRCEVSSNTYLAEEYRLDDRACETLTWLGWSAPTCGAAEADPGEGSPNFYVEVGRREADRLAEMTVTAFREVFAVAHPAFLAADALDEHGGGFDGGGAPSASPATEPDPDEPLAVMPRDRAHLRALVDAALTPVFGRVPEHDGDDDIPVGHGSAMVYVRVEEEAAVVKLFALVAGSVTDRQRAGFEVSVLNRDHRMLRFRLVEDQVVASTCVLGMPFAPHHLRTVLDMTAETLDGLDDDLVARVGGWRAVEPPHDADDADDEYDDADDYDDADAADDADEYDEDAPVHPAMRTILELEAEAPDSVTPELAASICDMDRTLILGQIAWNEEQQRAWRQARDEAADTDEAQVYGQEVRRAEQAVVLLRRALRVVVERRLAKDRQTAVCAEPAGATTQWSHEPWRLADGTEE